MSQDSLGKRVRARLEGRERPVALIVFVGLATLLGALWWLSGRETTDDARIEGTVHPISARVGGTVVAVHVLENQRVADGDLLFEIDPKDYEVALAAAEADLAQTRAALEAAELGVPVATTALSSELRAAEAARDNARSGVELAQRAIEVSRSQLRAAQARVDLARTEARRATAERDRLEPLVERDEISRQRWDDAVAAAEAAEAAALSHEAELESAKTDVTMADRRLEQARGDLARAEAELETAGTAPQRVSVSEAAAASARARVAEAEAAVERARLDLRYTRVRAPGDGVIGRKRVELGQVVAPAQPLLALVVLDDAWVVANFKETQLADMRPGQRARIEIDAYPGRTFDARVDSIGAATGARFSLLPSENASGNFVKVVQRVPVKLVFEQPAAPEQPRRPGLSVVATVLTRSPAESPDSRIDDTASASLATVP